MNIEAGSEDVVTFAVVGEVGSLVREGRSADGDGLLGGGGRVVARVVIVVAGGNGKVHAHIDRSIDGPVESDGFSSAQAHIGRAPLEAFPSFALLCRLDLLDVSCDRPLDTLDHVRHGPRPIRSEDFDRVDVGLLGDSVFLAGNGAGAVRAVTIAVFIVIAQGNGLAPVSTTLKVNVFDVRAGINDVYIHTFTPIGRVQVLVERAEAQGVSMRDPGKAPGSVGFNFRILHGVNLGVFLDEVDLDANHPSAFDPTGVKGIVEITHIRMSSNLLDHLIIEVARVTEEIPDVESVL